MNTSESEHTIPALCTRSRAISLEKGWLNPDGTDPRPFYTVIGLFHTELSEGFEDARANRGVDEYYYEVTESGVPGTKVLSADALEERRAQPGAPIHKAKPCGIPVELADFVIRVAQWAGSAGHGQKLSDIIDAIRAATLGERRVAENVELLITQLHADCSLAFVTAMGGLKNAGIPTDPLHYLATGVLTAFDFCQKNDIDLWGAIDAKEAYNRGREFKHGGKKH